jgi:hypothetical protein
VIAIGGPTFFRWGFPFRFQIFHPFLLVMLIGMSVQLALFAALAIAVKRR